MSYVPVPAEDVEARYPPSFTHVGSPAKPLGWLHRRSPYLHVLLGFLLGGGLLHLIDSRIAVYARRAAYEQGMMDKQAVMDIYKTPEAKAGAGSGSAASLQPGSFYRDHTPLRTAMTFYNLAEHEIAMRDDLDTCSGKLSQPFIDAYAEQAMVYCDGRSGIQCMPMHRSAFNNWWPYPQSICLSRGLQPLAGQAKAFRGQCSVTEDGKVLDEEMGGEWFLGRELKHDEREIKCSATENRTLLFISRQDAWNPFHVAEDIFTTFSTMILATVVSSAPGQRSLVDDNVQIIFQEGYTLDGNHFTPLWDRIGAWAPRRLSLDPWSEDNCLTNAIHSVGAGASVLSAPPIDQPFDCVSSVTWGTSHYVRHLFGLAPPTTTGRKPINILWISRAKSDVQFKHENAWSQWRAIRHINNEPELIARFRSGLAAMCEEGAAFSDEGGCEFEDFIEHPEAWVQPQLDGPRKVRFAHIDPTVHALETQIDFAGHTTIFVGAHGGALGLSIFMPPGQGALVELQVEGVSGNFQFQHFAREKGLGYEVVEISSTVDVENVWHKVEQWIATLGVADV